MARAGARPFGAVWRVAAFAYDPFELRAADRSDRRHRSSGKSSDNRNTISLMSTRQGGPPAEHSPSMSSSTAYRRRPKELHPFTQKAASSTSIPASPVVAGPSTPRISRPDCESKREQTAFASSSDSGQKRSPRGMRGTTPSIVCRSSLRRDRCSAFFIATCTTAGRCVLFVSLVRASSNACSYPSTSASAIRLVITPGKSALRAAVASDRPSRSRSCTGLPDHALIQIPDLDCQVARCIRDRAEVPEMAVAANPHGRAIGQRAGSLAVKPRIKAPRASTYVGVRRSSHFVPAKRCQKGRPKSGTGRFFRDAFFTTVFLATTAICHNGVAKIVRRSS
ncbi:hypothetical protein OKW28_004189 [Paraburkholderia sp. 40]